MILIKRLHLFLLRSFLPLFAMTFFIVLFIVLMQFLWRYIDDLVGKGLDMDILAELFFYAAVSMVPTALPLAILLASLMTFGNLGEKFELTAMKAAGVSLLRTMSPLIVLVSMVAVGAFFFQNDVLPKAQVKMWTLLFSVKQKSPELEIPEGVFYDRIPGFNLYVKHKNHNSGILHDVMIYDVSKGYEKSTILLSDSARLAFAGKGKYLYLHLWKGEQFDNLSDASARGSSSTFRRETFDDKQIFIPFDNNFNRLDEQGMRKQYVGKNISQLQHTIDSVQMRVDSMGRANSVFLRSREYAGMRRGTDKSGKHLLPLKPGIKGAVKPVHIDSLLAGVAAGKQGMILGQAYRKADLNRADVQFKIETMKDDMSTIRRHNIELMKKFTLSVACLLFFFIGAPLGAIIRKGGLGTPLVISVFIFIVYYIIDNTGYKLARDGKWPVWEGMWISTFILTPMGIYVTWQAMNDSAVFNPDAWRAFFTRITGITVTRSIQFKEVIINDISLSEALTRVEGVARDSRAFLERYKRPQLFFTYWLRGMDTAAVTRLSEELDSTADYLSDCRDKAVVNRLLDLPVITPQWVYQPARARWQSVVAMVLFPLSVPVWLVGMLRQRRLLASVRQAATTAASLTEMLSND